MTTPQATSRFILVVDDEHLVVETLVEVLTWEGNEVVQARNGEEALELIAQRAPDLLLIDFMMPIMDGLTAIRRLRNEPATTALPIILMTAAPKSIPTDEELYDALLVKPFNVKELRAAMDAVLGPGREH